MDLITRKEWGARAARGGYTPLDSTRGVKVHYTGGRVDPRLLDDHDKCIIAVRGVQKGHMDGNGWIDIGYSLVVCPHRKVFEGRGARHLPAANGPGLNSGHYAVLGLVGNSGLVIPPDDMLLGILDAIDYLRARGGAGKEIKGHCDGFATSCPGPKLYAWVKAGAPRPRGSSAPASKPASWTEKLVNSLPDIRPGMQPHQHVKTVRWLLGARGYPPKDLFSNEYREDDTDLRGRINAYKRGQDLAEDGIWGEKCWQTALD